MLPTVATKKQRKAYEYALKHPYSIWAMDPRLGKSMVAIAIQQKLRRNCLVICPGYLVSNWPKEISKWAAPDTLVTTFKKGKDIYDVFDADFVVVSFDLVQKAPQLFEWANMVVIDEVHNLKSMSAKRTQYIHQQIYENSIKRVHLLSGTILKNRVQEFYSPLAIMYYSPNTQAVKSAQNFGTFVKKTYHKSTAPKFLDTFEDEIAFADHFAYRKEYKVKITDRRKRTYYMPVAKWEGLRNVSELKDYLKGRYIRIKASKKDLPPIAYKKILVSNSPNASLLKAFEDHFDQDGMGSVKPEIKVEAAMQKVPFTIEYIEDLMRSVPCVLVYSDHVKPIEAIAKHFGCPAITGKMSAKKRDRLAHDFQRGKINMLFSTIGALKEGKDLYRAKHMVINDPTWIPSDMKQVTDRMRALGQKDPRTVHEIYGSPQDEKISEAIKEKMKVIDAAT